MSWQDVARRDLRSVYRSRMGPSVAIVALLSTVGVAALVALTASPEHPPPMDAMVVVFGSLQSFVVPFVALLATYSAIVGERTTGSIRFLLGLPNSRTDAYVGKFASRTLVVVAPIVLGLVLAGGMVAAVAENGTVLPFLWLALLSAVYGVLFVGAGLLASVLADTDTRAVALAVGAFAMLRAGWPAMQWAGLETMRDAHPRPAWFFWLGRINPINAYVRASTMFSDAGDHPLLTTPYRPPRGAGYRRELARESMAGTFVVSGEFALVVLAVLAVALPVAGWVYFRQRDML